MIDDPVSDEDKVVHLLASLPDLLVTALEANSETVPRMETVTERLLHEEQKLKEKKPAKDDEKALAVPKKGVICHYCRKPRHTKRECWKLAKVVGKKGGKHAANPARETSHRDEAW